MSTEEQKIKRSRRIHATQSATKRQSKIAKINLIEEREIHRFAKHHATNCSTPGCIMCGNPRRINKEETIQERRFKQDKVELE